VSRRSQKRGDPFYTSKPWREIRAQRLKIDNYRCQMCGCLCLGKKRGMPSPHVDHIKTRREHPELSLDINNLRTLCESHHNQRTRLDQLSKPQIGVDGYPIEEPGSLPPRHTDPFKLPNED